MLISLGMTPKSMFIYMYTVMMTYHAQVPFVLYSYKWTHAYLLSTDLERTSSACHSTTEPPITNSATTSKFMSRTGFTAHDGYIRLSYI